MKKIWFLITIIFCYLLITGIFSLSFAFKRRFFLILSHPTRPYLEFSEGFQSIEPKTEVFYLHKDIPYIKLWLQKSDNNFVCVGTKALQFLSSEFPNVSNKSSNIKIYYSLLLSPEKAKQIFPYKEICGIYLRPPPLLFLRNLHDIISVYQKKLKLKKPIIILISYSSSENTNYIENLKRIASNFDYKIISKKVESIMELKLILSQTNYDIYLAIPDPLYATEESIKYIVKLVFFQKKIFCGYNRFFLRQGALLAVVFDFYLAGQEAAKLFTSSSCRSSAAPFRIILNKKVLNFLLKNVKK